MWAKEKIESAAKVKSEPRISRIARMSFSTDADFPKGMVGTLATIGTWRSFSPDPESQVTDPVFYFSGTSLINVISDGQLNRIVGMPPECSPPTPALTLRCVSPT